ncbi:hypothetical protein [Actinokineospora sp.]|uniref:hypothetical protein n=1 Tax=Actinokineospora sp. TaxID=1872133 RepID=UPI0040382E2F
MTTVIGRRRLLVALFAVLGLVLSACSSGPSQVNAAAIVNGETIGVDRVQDLVDKAVKAEPAAKVLVEQRKLDLLSRAVLRQLVLHELIKAYTAKNPITVDPGRVAELAKQLTESLEPLPTDGTAAPEAIIDSAINKSFDATELAQDYLTLAEIGAKQAPTLSVTFDFSLIAPGGPEEQQGSLRAQALDKARQLAEGLDQAGRVIDADVAAGLQAAKDQTITPALAPDIAGSALFGTPENTVVAFQPDPQSATWVVALVRKRDTNATPDGGAQAPDPRLATTLGPRLLQSTVAEAGVKISPRYGVWDLAAMAIAPSEGETVGVVIPVKNTSAR